MAQGHLFSNHTYLPITISQMTKNYAKFGGTNITW